MDKSCKSPPNVVVLTVEQIALEQKAAIVEKNHLHAAMKAVNERLERLAVLEKLARQLNHQSD